MQGSEMCWTKGNVLNNLSSFKDGWI